MINIPKRPEPSSLTTYRAKPGAKFDGDSGFPPVKNDIRRQALQEQGYICCYCMKRIAKAVMQKPEMLDSELQACLETDVRIEHWHCQEQYPDEDLRYNNMLASCTGNEGQGNQKVCCDVKKRNDNLKYNPADPAHDMDRLITYKKSGEIESPDDEFDRQLSEVLNLNHETLVNDRKAVYRGAMKAFGKNPGTWSPSKIQSQVQNWEALGSQGERKQYCGIVIYLLKKKRH